MKLTRSAGVSDEAVPIRRGSIRRKVEVVEKPPERVDFFKGGVVDSDLSVSVMGMDMGGVDFTAFMPTSSAAAMSHLSVMNQVFSTAQTQSAIRRSIQQPREEEGVRVPFEMVESLMGTLPPRVDWPTFAWEQIVGQPRQGCRYEVEMDIRTREYLIVERINPGYCVNVEITPEELQDLTTPSTRAMLDIEDLRRIDWHGRFDLPREAQLVQVRDDMMRRSITLTFEGPRMMHSVMADPPRGIMRRNFTG